MTKKYQRKVSMINLLQDQSHGTNHNNPSLKELSFYSLRKSNRKGFQSSLIFNSRMKSESSYKKKTLIRAALERTIEIEKSTDNMAYFIQLEVLGISFK